MSADKIMSRNASYSKLFAPPKFLEMPAVSLEIRPEAVHFLLVKNTEKGTIPDIFGSVSLPEGAVLQGEIINKEAVVKAFSDIKKKTKVNFARLSLPEEKTYIFKVRLPDLKPREIREILSFKIEENVSLSADEAVFDYEIVPNTINSDGSDVIVSVAPAKIVNELQNILELAGLVPVFFSPESNNVAKSVVKESNKQIVVVANIKESSTVFSLVVRGVVCQTSSIGFGGSTFTDLIAKNFQVSLDEALKIKREKLYSDNPSNMEIFSYMINTISALKDEIYKFITYCNEGKANKDQVERIILCGQEAMILGLERYLSSNLGLNVDIANVWINNFDLDAYVPTINKIDSMNMAVVNGLSLF